MRGLYRAIHLFQEAFLSFFSWAKETILVVTWFYQKQYRAKQFQTMKSLVRSRAKYRAENTTLNFRLRTLLENLEYQPLKGQEFEKCFLYSTNLKQCMGNVETDLTKCVTCEEYIDHKLYGENDQYRYLMKLKAAGLQVQVKITS